MIYNGCCNECKNFIDEYFYNGSTDCKKADCMTEEDLETYFINGAPRCPYFEKYDFSAEDQYYNDLLKAL